jgi:CspA family cold shock protein
VGLFGLRVDLKDGLTNMTHTDENEPVQKRVLGIVKWFDPVKGFGFVVSEDGGADILLHVNVLRNYGQSSVADGSRVDLLVQETDRGVQASEVLSVVPPEGAYTTLDDIAEMDKDEIARSPMMAARIKWFDKAKGFGFANAFGKSEDIFVHVDVLRQSGLSDLAPGEAIAMRVIEGKRGRMAAEVQAWETIIIADEDSSQD